jgi:hypothetical protein
MGDVLKVLLGVSVAGLLGLGVFILSTQRADGSAEEAAATETERPKPPKQASAKDAITAPHQAEKILKHVLKLVSKKKLGFDIDGTLTNQDTDEVKSNALSVLKIFSRALPVCFMSNRGSQEPRYDRAATMQLLRRLLPAGTNVELRMMQGPGHFSQKARTDFKRNAAQDLWAVVGDTPSVDGAAAWGQEDPIPFVYVKSAANLPDAAEIARDLQYQTCALALRKLYEGGYRFPLCVVYGSFFWAPTARLFAPSFKEWAELNRKSGLTEDAYRAMLWDVVTLREPVNIAMNRRYDPDRFRFLYAQFRLSKNAAEKLQDSLDAGLSGYDAWRDRDRLPPNIAILCQTPLFRTKIDLVKAAGVNADRADETMDHAPAFWVLSLIGFAFDSEAQADFEYFKKQGLDCLVQHIKSMWRKAIQAAQSLERVKEVHYCEVGCGAFASLLPEILGDGVKLKPLQESIAKFSHRNFHLEGTKELLGTNLVKATTMARVLYLACLIECLKETKILETTAWRKIGTVPGEYLRVDRPGELLLCNAWDPHSIAGNGNFADESLDGYFGRSSAIGPLCWPVANHFLEQQLPSGEWQKK